MNHGPSAFPKANFTEHVLSAIYPGPFRGSLGHWIAAELRPGLSSISHSTIYTRRMIQQVRLSESLLPQDVEAVARHAAPVELTLADRQAIEAGHERLASVAFSSEAHYGINTGFGKLSQQRIPNDQLADLQRNLIRSHAAGAGSYLSCEIVRGMMLLLARSLSQGLSGIRPEVVELIVGMLNAGVTPRVPELGSVGASGDLAPLSHIAEVLIGEGIAETSDGQIVSGAEALASAGLSSVELGPKEGLALINGTHLMAARAALAWCDFERLASAATLAAAMSIDAARATDNFLDPRIYVARNQAGPAQVASAMRELIAGSEVLTSHELNDPRVQDPYSFRASAIILGSALSLADSVKQAIEAELGAVTDNPLIFPSETDSADVISAANFHGMPVALPADALAMSVSHIAGASERRVYHMLSGFDPEANLPPFLAREPGLHSGLMIVQYTAAAACNELIGLANPASVANISTSAGMEDYNSYGPRSLAKLDRAIQLARTTVAIELLCASEAMEHHRPLKSGHAIEQAIGKIRAVVPAYTQDRSPAPDISAIESLIETGAFSGL